MPATALAVTFMYSIDPYSKSMRSTILQVLLSVLRKLRHRVESRQWRLDSHPGAGHHSMCLFGWNICVLPKFTRKGLLRKVMI